MRSRSAGRRRQAGFTLVELVVVIVLIGLMAMITVTKLDFLTTFPKIYSGRHLSHPKIELVRGASVSVEADPPLPVVLDGEQPGTTPARFEIVPGAIRVRVPG